MTESHVALRYGRPIVAYVENFSTIFEKLWPTTEEVTEFGTGSGSFDVRVAVRLRIHEVDRNACDGRV